MVTLAETILLFALHDKKGTVHSAAYLAIDPVLAGALLSELRLSGYIQSSSGGTLRHNPKAPEAPHPHELVQAAAESVAGREPGPATEWLSAVEDELDGLRGQLVERLEAQGVLSAREKDRVLLPDSEVHPMANGSIEEAARRSVRTAVRSKEFPAPRVGILTALTTAAHLTRVVFEAPDRDAARQLSDRVADRDAIVRAVRSAVEEAEGSY